MSLVSPNNCAFPIDDVSFSVDKSLFTACTIHGLSSFQLKIELKKINEQKKLSNYLSETIFHKFGIESSFRLIFIKYKQSIQ